MTLVVAVLAALAVLLLVAAPPRSPSRALSVPALPARRETAAARRRHEREWLEALVAELRAGRDPSSALGALAGHGELGRALAASTSDPVSAMRATGRSLMLAVAACWEVAAGTGAGLAASLGALADAAREDERVRRELRAGLAEPRATAVVLAALPVVGMLLGAALGADPLSWLLGTSPGRLVALGGALLEVVGLAWSWRIVRSLEAEL